LRDGAKTPAAPMIRAFHAARSAPGRADRKTRRACRLRRFGGAAEPAMARHPAPAPIAGFERGLLSRGGRNRAA
jgi:hypothetical protein